MKLTWKREEKPVDLSTHFILTPLPGQRYVFDTEANAMFIEHACLEVEPSDFPTFDSMMRERTVKYRNENVEQTFKQVFFRDGITFAQDEKRKLDDRRMLQLRLDDIKRRLAAAMGERPLPWDFNPESDSLWQGCRVIAEVYPDELKSFFKQARGDIEWLIEELEKRLEDATNG